jgi:hypothetical protein
MFTSQILLDEVRGDTHNNNCAGPLHEAGANQHCSVNLVYNHFGSGKLESFRCFFRSGTSGKYGEGCSRGVQL